jgi:ankyrin repeat protein
MSGTFCKHYDIAEKNKAMKKLLDSMSNTTYWNKRRAVLILVHAGADNAADKIYPLLWRAIHQNDKEMVTALLENDADPNQKNFYTQQSHWFDITDLDIANLFINHRVDLHINKKGMYPNIVWHALVYGYPLELIELYVNHNVNVKRKNVKGYTIWHHYVECSLGRSDIKNYMKIGELLFKIVPEMINTTIDKKKIHDEYIHEKSRTPLNLAYSRLHNSLMPNKKKKVLESVIHLLEKYGAVDMIDTSESSD